VSVGDLEERPNQAVEVYLGGERRHPLMHITPLPAVEAIRIPPPPSAFLAAIHTIGLASPALRQVVHQAAALGNGVQVVFRPEIVARLREGSLRLMEASDGVLPVAIDASGTIVAQGRVVSLGGVARGAAAGAGAGALAMVALPIAVASAAAYLQQRQLEKSLASIQAVVERIEERLEDLDNGVCEAAEGFLSLADDALADGGLSGYLRLELAAQRTAIEALYAARKRWVDRFKRELERQQTERENKKGRGQPWVDAVTKEVERGKLERELTLFVRSLLNRTKLSVLAAAILAEEGRGTAALRLIERAETDLRSEFFDLHRRLVPLAKYAPELSKWQKLPRMGANVQRAHDTVRTLVEHLNAHVLPIIPDPDDAREIVAVLDPATVATLAAIDP
jgi:hypothetical protein